MNYIKDQKELNGKIVLLRLDLNVPLKNGKITDENRINKILFIFKYLIQKNSKIVVISHIGRPKGKRVDELSLRPICESVKQKLGKKIKLITDDIHKLNKEKLFDDSKDQIILMPTTNSAYGTGNRDNYCDENSINQSKMFNDFANYVVQSSLPLTSWRIFMEPPLPTA